MIHILAIGNSFSTDATRYLHDLAKAAGEDITVAALYIPGCPLSRHYRNMMSGERAYELEINGQRSGFHVSLKEALLNRDWHYVTVQQSSPCSTNYDTYQPYLNELAAFVRRCVPKAKVLVHETWAYEQDSERLNVRMGYTDYHDMYNDLHAAYAQAAQDIHADGLIPCGTAMLQLMDQGLTVHRDTFHASFGLGRYTLALTWLRAITGADVSQVTLPQLDEPVKAEELALARKAVMAVLP